MLMVTSNISPDVGRDLKDADGNFKYQLCTPEQVSTIWSVHPSSATIELVSSNTSARLFLFKFRLARLLFQ